MTFQHTAKFLLCAICAISFRVFISSPIAQGSAIPFQGIKSEAYTRWLSNAPYEKSTFLPSTSDTEGGGVVIHWTVNQQTIYLAVAAQATGWAAFGLAESGSMRGADIVLYTSETDTLVDSYVLDQLVQPLPDKCQSWELVNSEVSDGLIIFEAKRLLNTTDAQDRVIIDDSLLSVPSTRVIAAWGNASEPSYHGKSTARGSIRFFGTSDSIDEEQFFVQSMANEAEGNFTISAQEFVIPTDVTTYQWLCFSREDLLSKGVPLDEDLHTIGIEPLIPQGSQKYVHHFVVYGSSMPWNNTLECGPDTYPGIETAYTWAPGDLPLALPPNVGGPLGSNGFQSFAIEIHYNNADLDVNVSDSSGIRVYFTSIKREFDLGIFDAGDPLVLLEGGYISSDGGLAQHAFGCDQQCLGSYLTEPVTVIKEHLHMHMTGVSMVNNHIRNDQVIRQGRVDFWDFAQQGDLLVVQAPFQIYPGDSFRTVCNYNADNTTKWGLGSHDEMCMASFYYYPRQLVDKSIAISCGLGFEAILPGCNTSYAVTPDFSTEAQLERAFGGAPASCPNIEANAPTPPVTSPTNEAYTSTALSTKMTIFTLFVHQAFFWNTLIALW